MEMKFYVFTKEYRQMRYQGCDCKNFMTKISYIDV